jgi:hypothetical protein
MEEFLQFFLVNEKNVFGLNSLQRRRVTIVTKNSSETKFAENFQKCQFLQTSKRYLLNDRDAVKTHFCSLDFLFRRKTLSLFLLQLFFLRRCLKYIGECVCYERLNQCFSYQKAVKGGGGLHQKGLLLRSK